MNHFVERLERNERKQKFQTAGLVFVVVLAGFIAAAGYFGLPIYRVFDEANLPGQHGIGLVRGVLVLQSDGSVSDPGATVTVTVGSNRKSVFSYDTFHVGERVNVTYKTGHSGRFNIDDRSPIKSRP